jgi:hypothetical protein
VRLSGPKSSESGDELVIEWDDTPDGATWVAPTKLSSASLALFSSCPADKTGKLPTFSPGAGRSLGVKLEKGWAKTCAGATVTLRVTIAPSGYGRACKSPQGGGMLVHVLEGTFTLDASGEKVVTSRWKGGHYFEG